MEDASDLLRSAEIISLANVVLVGTSKHGTLLILSHGAHAGLVLLARACRCLPAGCLGTHCLRANPGRG